MNAPQTAFVVYPATGRSIAGMASDQLRARVMARAVAARFSRIGATGYIETRRKVLKVTK